VTPGGDWVACRCTGALSPGDEALSRGLTAPSAALADMKPSSFLSLLTSFPDIPDVFNPWKDYDPENDASARAPLQRAEQLERYLVERVGRARLVLCAEAGGYQGKRQSGIAMTSERMLLGHLAKSNGIFASDVIQGGGQRTSSAAAHRLGVTEPTATIVWGALKASGIDTRHVVLWNAFAFHPMKPGEALSNRPPTVAELAAGQEVLESFLSMFPSTRLIAIGDVAKDKLAGLQANVDNHVRHPAWGGAADFRRDIAQVLAAPLPDCSPHERLPGFECCRLP
jgi:hypothetical protein